MFDKLRLVNFANNDPRGAYLYYGDIYVGIVRLSNEGKLIISQSEKCTKSLADKILSDFRAQKRIDFEIDNLNFTPAD